MTLTMLETSSPSPSRHCIPSISPSRITLCSIVWIIGFTSIFVWQKDIAEKFLILRPRSVPPAIEIPVLRPAVFDIKDFGGVADGVTVNTVPFERAVNAIWEVRERGGGQLNVGVGKWLTAPFNLTSHMTLFLAQGAEILGIDVSLPYFLVEMLHLPIYVSLLFIVNILVSFAFSKSTTH